MSYNTTYTRLVADAITSFVPTVPAIQDNVTLMIGPVVKDAQNKEQPSEDFNATIQALLNNEKFLNDLVDTLKKRQIISGDGLTGGGDLSADRTLNLKKATKIELGGIIVGDNLTVDPNGKLNGNPDVDISGKLDKGTYSGDAGDLKSEIDTKMSKYQTRYDIKDYDDLLVSGFYILRGSRTGVVNSPHVDATLVQVWEYEGNVYQCAVSPYNRGLNAVRSFPLGTKNTMWTIPCPYSVGDIYHTTRNEHPAVIWPFTTWEKIEGRFLLATSGSNASGATGGSNTKTIEQANLPNIKLQVDPFSLSVTPPDIQLYNDYAGNSESGKKTLATEGSASSAGWDKSYIRINSGGSTGTASPYTSALGSGTALDITPSFYTVHIWKRLT